MSSLPSAPGLYVPAGLLAGFVGGWLSYRLWRRLLPPSHSQEFWQSLPDSVRGMLTSDEPSDLFRHYRTLVVATIRYIGRSTIAAAAGIVPMAVLFLLLTALDESGSVATDVEVHPATLVNPLARLGGDWRMEHGRLLIDCRKPTTSSVELAGQTLDCKALESKQVFCATTLSCLLFDMMLFETHRIERQTANPIGGPVIVRPVLLDGNPLWPYLNDLDFWFFIAAILGSTGAAWGSRHRRVGKP
jgi:hypothetical protein